MNVFCDTFNAPPGELFGASCFSITGETLAFIFRDISLVEPLDKVFLIWVSVVVENFLGFLYQGFCIGHRCLLFGAQISFIEFVYF